MNTGRRRPEPADTGAASLPIAIAADITADPVGRGRATEALRESESKYRHLFEAASDAVFVVAMDTSRLIDANVMASSLYGYDHDELLTMKSTDLSAEPEETQARQHEAQMRPGQVFTVPLRLHRKKDGTVVPVEITARSVSWDDQPVLLVACRDITARRQAEEDLARLNQQHELILRSAAEGILGLDPQGDQTFVNPAAASMLGYAAEELLGRPSHSTWHHTRPDGAPYPNEECPIYASLRDGEVHRSSAEVFWRKDGASFPVEYESTPIYEQGRLAGAVVTFADITERKQAEQLLSVQAEILTILTSPIPAPESAERIVVALRRATGFDAVGMRMRQGDDYPFLAATGHTEEFLRAESTLAVQNPDGGLCRNEDGSLSLECTCGLVLSGDADPANPLFTPGGSAWTNDSLPFLDVRPEDDPRLHPRNRCIHLGFRSVALVPLPADNEIIGLLHLADRRKDRFTAESIRFYEGVAASIGIALLQRRAVDELARGAVQLREQLHDTVQAMGAIVGLRDPYTAAHEQRVTVLAAAIAAELALGDEAREGLAFAAEVHDIGKIGVPSEILSKPGALSAVEYAVIKQHPEAGRDLLSAIRFHQPVAEIVAQHQERLDGSGYPRGLRGTEIMPEARILAVADVVEAMASHRPYRPALGVAAALEEVRAGAGLRYDADAVAACEHVFARGFVFSES